MKTMLTGLIAGVAVDCYLGFIFDVPAGAITSGRARAMVAAAVSLISVVIGGLARARGGRGGAIAALVLGLIGVILSVVHLATFTGGFGTGGGRAGAIVALVLGLIGVLLGGLALGRGKMRGAKTQQQE